MNLIFDRNTLRVVSLFDNELSSNFSEENLCQMFPDRFRTLSVWQVNHNISQNPIHLRVKLDKYKNPEALLYKKKVIYKVTEEDKKKSEEKRLAEKRKHLPPRLVLSDELGMSNELLIQAPPIPLPRRALSLKSFSITIVILFYSYKHVRNSFGIFIQGLRIQY